MPAWIAPAIGAASSILGNVLNSGSTKRENRRNRDFAVEMYNRQRADSLADWALQNEYNSPKSQMARLRDAGLNPMLVYGNGADAQSSAPPRSSSVPGYTGQAPQVDLSGIAQSIMDYTDVKMKEAQTDNLTKQNTVIAQDAILRAAQTQATLADAHTKEFDLKMKNELKEINMELAKDSAHKVWAEAKKASNEAELSDRGFDNNAKLQDLNYEKAKSEAEKALNEAKASSHLETRVKQEIDNLKKDGDLKQFEINLNKLGLGKGDPIVLRILTTLFGKFMPKP